eukprot:scaffold57761_cov43-Prasinocladus_malaysianus.AAC.1
MPPPSYHKEGKEGEESPTALLHDLHQQLEWQRQSYYQLGLQMREQQQMQTQMARQLEWQGRMMCHLQQTLLPGQSPLPPLPPMLSDSARMPPPSPFDMRSGPPSWSAYPPRAAADAPMPLVDEPSPAAAAAAGATWPSDA